MLPFDNKNEILFLVDMEEGTTLERTDAVVRRIESVLASQPEVINYVSTVGASGPIDFNGMVRHYYLRSRPFQARCEPILSARRIDLSKVTGSDCDCETNSKPLQNPRMQKSRLSSCHQVHPYWHHWLRKSMARHKSDYQDVLKSAATVADRMRREPGVAEVDDIREASVPRLVFETRPREGGIVWYLGNRYCTHDSNCFDG